MCVCVCVCVYARACLFLESGPFTFIIPKESNFSRYLDSILLIYPRNNA